MSEPRDPAETDFDETHTQLSDGLRSCQAVISNYRALLAQEAQNDNRGPGADSDEKLGSAAD